MEDPTSTNPRAWENTPDDTLYPLPERPEFLRHVPILGRWQPPHSLPPNSAAAHFMMSLINNRNFTALEDHGSKLRNGQKCSILLDQVIVGGQHVIVKLFFEDGVVWVARISFPRCVQTDGHISCVGGFRDFCKEALCMESEIATLQYVKEKTNIPVPKVFGYNLCNDNGVGGPYMLMEMVFGESLDQYIERCGGISHIEVKRILDQMSYYISQLSKLRFNGIGRLRFGESPCCPRLVPIEESNDPEPYDSAARYFTQQLAQCVPPPGQNDYPAVFEEIKWTMATFNEKVKISTLIFHRAAQFLGHDFSSGPFPLQHVDLNQQNIIVDEQCNVCGIVDWENAVTSPLEVYDIQLMRIFRLWWQDWKGLDWVEEYAFGSFMELENDLDALPKLSVIYRSENGGLARILMKPFSEFQFVEYVRELVEYLYCTFEENAVEIVPRDVATEIIEDSGSK